MASHKYALESIPPGKYIFTQESTKIIKFQYTLIQTYRPENKNCLGVVPTRRYQSTLYINDMDEKSSHWDFRIKFWLITKILHQS